MSSLLHGNAASYLEECGFKSLHEKCLSLIRTSVILLRYLMEMDVTDFCSILLIDLQ